MFTFEQNRRSVIATFAALYIFCLMLNLAALGRADLQSDERHWSARSFEFVKRLDINPSQATTHVGHPGVTAVLVMGTAQSLAIRYNSMRGLKKSDPAYVLMHQAARLGNATVSSLIPPVLYAGLLALFGSVPALLAGILAALDPALSSGSQMAHLDSILTLCCLLAALLYIHAVRQESLRLKLWSGVFWGLAIATKPTAGVLIPALFAYRAFRSLLLPRQNLLGEKSLLSWSDIYCFLIGHAVFAAVFTRLWLHKSDYLLRLHVRFWPAGRVWALGVYLQDHALLVLLICCALTCAFIYLQRDHSKTPEIWKHHLSALCVLFVLALLVLTIIPQVPENILRYWRWASGLQNETHQAFGRSWVSIPGGYLTLFLLRTPALVIFGIALAILALIFNLRRIRKQEIFALYMFFAAFPLLLLFLLNISGKQTWRYALPALPFTYTVSALGISAAALAAYKALKNQIAPAIILIIPVLFSLAAYGNSWPRLSLYYNSFAGGIQKAAQLKIAMPQQGQPEIIKFIEKASKKIPWETQVAVLGDVATLQFAHYDIRRLYGSNVRYGVYDAFSSDFLTVFASFEKTANENEWQDLLGGAPIFEVSTQGFPVARVFEVPFPAYKQPLKRQFHNSHHATGRVSRANEDLIIVVQAGIDKPAAIFFMPPLRFAAGNYVLRYRLRLPDSYRNSALLRENSLVAESKLGARCDRPIFASDLKVGEWTTLSFPCSIDSPLQLPLALHWLGTVSVEGLEFELSAE